MSAWVSILLRTMYRQLRGSLRLLSAGAILVAGFLGLVGDGGAQGADPGAAADYGILSLLPAATAIVLAFLTREVLVSLFLGICVGGLISGNLNILQAFLIPAIGSSQYGLILLVYLWSLGGLIGVWTRTGGAQAFAEWSAEHLVRGRRSAKVFAWFMGVVFHQGGTISTVLTGTTVRVVTDGEKVSHEELSYIVDSTASPIAGLIPLNIWPIYVGGLVAGTIPLIPDQEAGVSFFYRSIPMNFYSIFAVSMTLLLSLEWLPWTGRKMAAAMERAQASGELNAPEARPLIARELTETKVPEGYRPSILDFAVPIIVLIGFALGSYLVVGSVKIAEAFGLALLSGFILAMARGLAISELVSGFVDGCKGVTSGAILLGLAITLGRVSEELGTASYIVDLSGRWIVPVLLPALLLFICMAVSFSIGTSFGTFAVMFPLAMPLAWSISTEPMYVMVCFGAVVGGSMFGDQCSPISDTTILSSLACGADLMDHVTTQLPLALVAATLAGICAVVTAFLVL